MSISVFSKAGLISWLRMQDPKTTYEYSSSYDCLICRYFRARGVFLSNRNPVGPEFWIDGNGLRHGLPEGLNKISFQSSLTVTRTYGSALAYAEEMI